MTQTIVEQQEAGLEPAEMAEVITDIFNHTFTALIARRDKHYANAIVPLDNEAEQLRQEHAAREHSAHKLEALLPAKARVLQYESDVLLVAGKADEAEAKAQEQREAEAAPQRMRQRQHDIVSRLEAIAGDKQALARNSFEQWYRELQIIIRAVEAGLFLGLLDNGHKEMCDFAESHGLLATLDRPYDAFPKTGHIIGLTADGNSPVWAAASKWYGGGRR